MALAQIEEITVTARRRAERLQDTPISITAFTDEELRRITSNQIDAIGRRTPNLEFNFTAANSGGSNATAYIRGIGQTDFLVTVNPGVGIYLDGVYLGRATGASLDLLDVERIEVLRGPQGTLFGRNTIGGAIRVITKDPNMTELEGFAQVTAGNLSRIDGQVGVSGPLIEDKLAVRLTAASNNRNGFGDIEMQPDRDALGDVENQVVRGAVLWEPNSRLSFALDADYSHQDQETTAYDLVEVNPAGSVISLFNAFAAPAVGAAVTPDLVDGDIRDINNINLSVNDHEIWGISLTAGYDAGPVQLKSISAYRNLEAEFGRDADATGVEISSTRNMVEQEQFSQELQLSGRSFENRLDWVTGLYYYHEQATDDNRVNLYRGLFDALEALPTSLDNLAMGNFGAPQTPGVPGGPGNPVNVALDLELSPIVDIETNSYAAFGEFTYDLSEKFSVTGGVRYSVDLIDNLISQTRRASGAVIFDGLESGDRFGAWTGRAGLEYKPTDRSLLYFSASRGFKSGGFNGRPTQEAQLQSFGPEFVWTYEIGAKADLWDNRLRTNLALFYSDYTDIQLQIRSFDPQTGTFVELTDNAAAATIKGIELETSFVPNEWARLDFNLSVLDAEYDDIGQATINPNNEFPRAPDLTTTTILTLFAPLPARYGSLNFQTEWAYNSGYFVDTINTQSTEQGDFNLWDMRLTYTSPGETWELTAFANNVFDEVYIESGGGALESLGVAEAYAGLPRLWGVRGTWRY